jgi:hypothetical protein
MAKESVLTLTEKESIKIEKFIFHIIIENEDEPQYLDEVVISDEQKEFFRQRLIAVSQGNQLLFNDKETNGTYLLAKSIIEDIENNFLIASKKLTADFKSRHNKNTSNGVFITALITIENKRKLIFLVKLDHKKVYEYTLKGTKALLAEIKNTFIEDKSAIQKVALIDTSDHYIWDTLAYDRAKPGGLTEYFKSFLGVRFRDTPSKWTVDAVTHANHWATRNRDIIDPDQEPSKYKNRAITYLSSTSLFSTDDYINNVIFDEDENRREILKKSFLDFITEKGLAGQEFPPNKGSLTSKIKKNTVLTNEGVKIEWDGDAEKVNVNIPNQKNPEDGLYHIEILTNEITNLK